jgi:hypothetical protein
VSFTLPFRLPVAECLLLITMVSLLVVTALLSVREELMGDPIQFGELELVAVRGLGTACCEISRGSTWPSGSSRSWKLPAGGFRCRATDSTVH